MKSKISLYIGILFCFGLVPSATQAFEVRVDPDLNISEDFENTDENLYIVGLRTFFDTTHQKDIVSIAWEQAIGGTVFGDIFLFGDTVSLFGEYFDDVRIAANNVYVTGVTNEDLAIVARTIVIEEEAILNGENLFFANTVLLNGQVLGESQITANNVEISGSILAPATITTAQKLSIHSSANIISEISYFSPQRAIIDSEANIQRQPNFNQIESISQHEVMKRIFFAFVSFWSIIKLIATLFIIFILTQLFRVFSQRVVDIVYIQRFYSILIGVAYAIFIPVLIIILFGSLVLIPVAMILSFVFGIIFIILPAISSIITASLYQRFVQKINKPTIDFNMSALALIVLTFVWFIPVFGTIIKYVLYLVSISAVYTYIYEQVRGIKKK